MSLCKTDSVEDISIKFELLKSMKCQMKCQFVGFKRYLVHPKTLEAELFCFLRYFMYIFHQAPDLSFVANVFDREELHDLEISNKSRIFV